MSVVPAALGASTIATRENQRWASLLGHEWRRGSAEAAEGSAYELDLPAAEAYVREEPGLLLIIDEPERHLHPRLQREAVAWVEELAPRLQAQCLLASHSVPFLGISGPVAHTQLIRPGAVTSAVPLPVEALSALDAAADELGFDRGELLTTRRVLAFVEGRFDKLVLETLFAARLRRAGVELIGSSSPARGGSSSGR